MQQENAECPLCLSSKAIKKSALNNHRVHLYVGCGCGCYYVADHDATVCLKDPTHREEWRPLQIRALLREWRSRTVVKDDRHPFLQFLGKDYPNIGDAVPVVVPDLLAQWPDTIPEKIERCFCHVIRSMPGRQIGGREVEITGSNGNNPLIFAESDIAEQNYFVDAMVKYEWVTARNLDEYGRHMVCVTPKGWAHFDELDRGCGDAKNAAFVAMWFGGGKQKDRMHKLYAGAIKPAIKAAGYEAKRADTDEHNDPIMDRVIEYIRKAPFIVADLTDNNQGVYYEAGLATGWGKPVVYCRPRTLKRVHFDIAGINQIIYDDAQDLREKLKNRIRATLGDGPHELGIASVSADQRGQAD